MGGCEAPTSNIQGRDGFRAKTAILHTCWCGEKLRQGLGRGVSKYDDYMRPQRGPRHSYARPIPIFLAGGHSRNTIMVMTTISSDFIKLHPITISILKSHVGPVNLDPVNPQCPPTRSHSRHVGKPLTSRLYAPHHEGNTHQ